MKTEKREVFDVGDTLWDKNKKIGKSGTVISKKKK